MVEWTGALFRIGSLSFAGELLDASVALVAAAEMLSSLSKDRCDGFAWYPLIPFTAGLVDLRRTPARVRTTVCRASDAMAGRICKCSLSALAGFCPLLLPYESVTSHTR